MKKTLLSAAVIAFLLQSASATLIESWENSADGWTISASGSAANQTNFNIAGFSSTQGITDGSFSLAIGASPVNTGSGPDYSQLLISTPSSLLTSTLANAASLSLDIFAPSGSFGGFLQFDIDVNNNDTGFVSLDSFSYPSTTIGSEDTLTVPITSGMRTTLSTSVNPTTLIIQVGGGYSAGNETFFVDNLRTTPVPEPTSLALMGLGAAGLALLRRRNS